MRLFLMLVILTTLFAPVRAVVFENYEERLARLEHRADQMDSVAGAAVLCAVICALWAQNTARNAWLWFFLGLIFSIIAIFVMLYKNAKDVAARKRVSRLPANS